jgi:hypothetical protein
MSGSLLFTIGTALNRAHQEGLTVQVLVEGQWLGGQVAWQDAQGVLLVTEMDEHAIVRLAGISAVKVLAASPLQPRLEPAATPMPA